jgi:exodeoxyribonuclease VII large subunit
MPDLFDLPFEDEDGDQPKPPAEAPPAPSDRPPAPPSTPVRQRAPLATRTILSVTELTIRVRDALEQQVGEIWVEGELSNCRVWNTGHLYFTLKDSGSQLRGFMFKSALRYLRFKPVDGTRVIARGRISVYEPKGEYQLVCEHLEPQGLGALQLAFDQLKKRLEAEGLFDAARKRALPTLPRKIGVVTSLDGAAVRDIIKVLRARHGNVHLVIRPARVQGEGAALDLAKGIRAIGRVTGIDVLIVGRGGGSIEDLWAFNEEVVVRAIAQSPVPVISAVGHETDVTIADFAADVRAATPSAAAELVVARKDEFRSRLGRLRDRLTAAERRRVQTAGRRVHIAAARPAFAGYPARLAMRDRRIADLANSLMRFTRASMASRIRLLLSLERQLATYDAGRRLASLRTRLVAADGRMTSATIRRRDRAVAQVQSVAGRLESLSPLAVLARGYAVAWNADKSRVLRDASLVSPGETIRVTLSRGEIEAKVSDGA